MKIFIKYKSALPLLLLVLMLPTVAYAAVNLSVEADKKRVQAGDTVEVIVTVSGKGLAIAEGSFTYDPAVLTYAESEGGASDGFLNMVSAEKGGADTLSARIRFKAVGAGSVKIEASIEKALGYDGKEQEGASDSVSVSVSAPAKTPAPTPRGYAAEGVPAKNVKGAKESMFVWRTLENVTVPSHYSETTLTYHGETVAAAKAEDSNAPTLVYLSGAGDDAGGYYIFDEAADILYPYQTVSSVSKSYILLEPDTSVKLPEGFSQTTLTIGEKEYMAWKSEGAQPVYLLYARNPNGEIGYFVYNAEDESLQRYAVMPAGPIEAMPPEAQGSAPEQAMPEQSPAPEKMGEITLNAAAFYAMCAGLALLLIATAWLLTARFAESRRRHRAAQRRAEHERTERHERGM